MIKVQDLKNLAIAFSGPSNSGKTTLIVKLAEKLKEKYKLAIVKHDPGDKAVFDKEGKDSWKFSQTGADVVIASPTRTTLFSKKHKKLHEIIDMLDEFDFLFVEGLKTLSLPRISVFRNSMDESYFEYSNALAVDNSVKLDDYDIPARIDILDLNDTDSILEWIFKNAKRVK